MSIGQKSRLVDGPPNLRQTSKVFNPASCSRIIWSVYLRFIESIPPNANGLYIIIAARIQGAGSRYGAYCYRLPCRRIP